MEDDPKALAAVRKAICEHKYGEALKMLEQVPDTRRGLGYWMATGRVRFALEGYEAAQVAFGKAAAIDPNSTEALLKLALTLRVANGGLYSNDWDVVIELCNRVLKIDPNSAQAHCILGITPTPAERTDAYSNGNMYGLSAPPSDRPIGFLRAAAALDPRSFAAQYNLGVVLLLNKRYQEAISALSAALDLAEGEDYLFVRKRSFISEFSTTKSILVLVKLLLFRAYSESRQYEHAVGTLKEVLTIERDNPVAPWWLYLTYRDWGRAKDTLYWAERSPQVKNHVWYMQGNAYTSFDMGCPEILTIGKPCQSPHEAGDSGTGENETSRREAEDRERAVEAKRLGAEREAQEKRYQDAEKAGWRVWTDKSGAHTVEAQFKGVIGGQVKLVKKDGTGIFIPLENLSEEDRAWIQERKKQ